MNSFHVEDKDLGKIFDRRIISRLYQFVKPYLKYVAIAASFLIIAAGAELVFPYMMKIAIDQYIIKSGRMVAERITVNSVEAGSGKYFVTQEVLAKIDPGLLHSLEKEGKITKGRYYYFFQDQVDDKVRSVAQNHPQLFETYGNLVVISYDNLKSLRPNEILMLRAKDFSNVLKIALFFLAMIFFGAIANFIQIYFQQYAGQLFMHSMRMKIFRKLQDLDLSFFDRSPIGRLVTRATNDVEAINEALTDAFTTLVRDILLLIGIVILLLWINLKLALIAFTVIPLVLVLTSYFRIRARKIYRTVRQRLARLNAALQENLSGIRAIKIFSQEPDNNRSFDHKNLEYLESNLQEVVLMSFFRPVIEVVSSLGIGLVLYYGGGQAITGELSLGVLVAFLAYIEMFFRPIRELTESYTTLQSAMASSERIFILLDEDIKIHSKPTAVELEGTRGEIEFRNVWFTYDLSAPHQDTEWILKDVSFRVLPGERIAIVGPTGAGKTSIISLISRFYDVQKGQILFDGKDVRDINLESLRSKIGVVMQDVFLFAGDIKSNIRLNLSIEDQQVKQIASYINADQFIDRFPNKYDEAVMERGVTLSTGERQLLSFARVLAFNPLILVLDEATANIDSGTEKLIHDGLKKLVVGRTSIIVAHRLSTIKEVDRIYVIHKGEIKEFGKHEELLKKKGIYYNLFKLQSIQ